MPPKAPNVTDAEDQVATNQQRRESAKRQLDRQLAQRAERARRRKIVGTGVTIGAVLVATGLVVFFATRGGSSDTDQASEQDTNSSAEATSGACQYQPDPEGSAGKEVGLPPDPKEAPDNGKTRAALKTNRGTIDITLDRAKAPCAVQSTIHLIKSGFYDDSPCHRLGTSDTLNVLQCGDPTGSGTGGPGYTIPDEPPENLKSVDDGKAAVYPRGTVAMAKTQQPDSGGSQFFLVHKDTTLPPEYTVFGTVDKDDMGILDEVAENGVEGDGDIGTPSEAVTIKSAELT